MTISSNSCVGSTGRSINTRYYSGRARSRGARRDVLHKDWGRSKVHLFRVKQLVLGLLLSVLPALSEACMAAEPQRPVVFIPGILGSRLIDPNGLVIWGDRSSLL